MTNPYEVVYTVMVTEKAGRLIEKEKRYSLKVNPKSNKSEIRQAVEMIFDGVKVSDVRTMNYLGKMKRVRSSHQGKRSDWKKAIVTLTEGSINWL